MSTRSAPGVPDKASSFAGLMEQLAGQHRAEDLDLISRAHDFACASHGDQARRSGEPYVNHTVAAASILAELHLDANSIAVALLHDVLEDTAVTRDELAELFGEEVAKLVEGVSKIGQIEFTSKAHEQADNYRKLLLAMVEDARVLLVKLADRLHNMRTLGWLGSDARRRIARETSEIYAPLAHRLGMGRIQAELEDLAFAHLEPEAFERLNKLVDGRTRAGKDFTERIKGEIEGALADHDIPCRAAHRIKGLLSLHRKMRDRDLDFDQVFDLIAFRITTDTVRNCYAALGIMHNQWSPLPGRFKDFIAMPKRNMYQSLHTTLMDRGRPFEVQIRTEEMHRVAEEGIAAHWLYKEGVDATAEETQPLAWLRQLVESQGEVSDPGEFLSSLKLNLYPDEVYVFTPDGDVKSLPRGATPIDFAYMIHTEIGQHCTGAKINGKLVPLRQQLRNGDIVEINTAQDASPSRDWLNLVETSRARNRIRNWLNKQERARSLELGRKILEKEFRKYGLRLKKLMSDGTLERIGAQFGASSAEDLLVAVSFGKVTAGPLIEKILPLDKIEAPTREPSRLRRMVDRALGWSAQGAIQVKGLDDIMVYRARCCGPVPGEAIVGYVTRGKGVSVHSTSCGNIGLLLETEDRRIDVVWKGEEGSVLPVRLRVEFDDRPGLFAALTSKIAEGGANIRHIESKLEGYKGRVDLILDVTDSQHLRTLVAAIEIIEGVRSVHRGRVP